MPRNTDGSYSRVVSPYEPGEIISAHEVNSEIVDIGSCLGTSISTDGSTRLSSDLSMEGIGGARYRHTDVARGTSLDHYADVRSVQENAYTLAQARREGNVLSLTVNPMPPAYSAGMQFFFMSPAWTESSAYTSPTLLKIGTLANTEIFGLIPASAPIVVTFLNNKFYASCAQVGAVLPANMPADRLLFYSGGKLTGKSIGQDGDVMPPSDALDSINTLADAVNKQAVLTYDEVDSQIVLTTVEKPTSALAKPYLGWDAAANTLKWKTLSGRFVKATTLERLGTPGSTVTWNKPTGLSKVRITLVGGGGGAGRGYGKLYGLPGGGGETVILDLEEDDLTEASIRIEAGAGGAGAEGEEVGSIKGRDGGDTRLLKTNNDLLSKASGGKGGSRAVDGAGLVYGGDGGWTKLEADRGSLSGNEIMRIAGKQGGLCWMFNVGKSATDTPATGGGGDSYFGGGGRGLHRQDVRTRTLVSHPGRDGGGASGSFGADGAAGGDGFVLIESWSLA